MAILHEISREQAEWIEERPQVIKDLIEKVPPNRLYLLKQSGHRVFPYSYSEDGTVTVCVSGEYNMLSFERLVFGIAPDDLEECDLPSEGEILGAVLTDENEVMNFIGCVKNLGATHDL